MKLLLIFKVTFLLGLALGVGLLLYQAEHLMRFLIYGGSAHVVFLSLLGYRLGASYAPLAVEVIHKAAFIHTLIALGAAVVMTGYVIGGESFTLGSLRLVLAPMGAALVPHAVGLISAQLLTMHHYDAKSEDVIELEALERLKERAELLQQQVTALREEQGCYETIRKALKEVEAKISVLRTPLGSLKEEILGIAREAREMREPCRVAPPRRETPPSFSRIRKSFTGSSWNCSTPSFSGGPHERQNARSIL